MGMYDNVNFHCKCPICGNELKNFQTKDGPCILTTLEPLDVNNFYDICDNCDAWVEFTFIAPGKEKLKRPTDIEDYIVKVNNTFKGYKIAVEHYKNPSEYKLRREEELKEAFKRIKDGSI